MKWSLINIPLFFLFLIYFFNPWGIIFFHIHKGSFGFLLLLLMIVAYPCVSVMIIVLYRNMRMVVPLIFFIIACFFSYKFQSWAEWNSDTLFWYWTGATLACVFAMLSIIVTEMSQKLFEHVNKTTEVTLLVAGLVSNLVIIGWTIFLVIAGQSGMVDLIFK